MLRAILFWGGGIGKPIDVCSWESRSDCEFPDLIPELPREKGEETKFGCHFRVDGNWASLSDEVGMPRKVRDGEIGKMNLLGSRVGVQI